MATRSTMAKRRTAPKDRISDLPRNLIDCILERMSTRDAARTSILSKKWRTKDPNNCQFFCEIKGNNTVIVWPPNEKYVKIVDKILIVHSGTIQKFNLYIPFSQSPDMDLWILILSRNGIQELTLDYEYSQPYNLPSYIFSCKELTYLDLCNCIIPNPPLEFRGFRNLNKLLLEKVSLSPKIGSLISRLPVLHDLSLTSCIGVEYLKVLPPKLDLFSMVDSHEFQWQCLNVSNSNLKGLNVQLSKEVDKPGEDFNLLILLGDLPKIVTLWLDGFALKFLAAGTEEEYMPINVYDLTQVRFSLFQFNDLEQISCALCLLRSSPNLRNLEASIDANEAKEQVVDYLEAQGNSDMGLNRLQIVRLSSFSGLKAEVLFAKLLLSHSPSLERMVIKNRSGIDANEVLRISMELMRFPRASPKAEIIYLP